MFFLWFFYMCCYLFCVFLSSEIRPGSYRTRSSSEAYHSFLESSCICWVSTVNIFLVMVFFVILTKSITKFSILICNHFRVCFGHYCLLFVLVFFGYLLSSLLSAHSLDSMEIDYLLSSSLSLLPFQLKSWILLDFVYTQAQYQREKVSKSSCEITGHA